MMATTRGDEEARAALDAIVERYRAEVQRVVGELRGTSSKNDEVQAAARRRSADREGGAR